MIRCLIAIGRVVSVFRNRGKKLLLVRRRADILFKS